MKAEEFVEINYHSKAGLEADKLIEDKTGKEVSFEEIAEAYHEHKLKLSGIANVSERLFKESEVKEICRNLARICTPSEFIEGIDDRFEQWWKVNFNAR